MKKLIKHLTVGIALPLALLVACTAIAGNVADRAKKNITASVLRWTNDTQYAAVELKRIWITANSCATDVVTVVRVTADGVDTQAVGSITCTASAGSTASFTAAYLKPGDMLAFSQSVGTTCTAMVEYEVQKH